MNDEEKEIYSILEQLLHAIRKQDLETYKKLSAEDLTCIEPETYGDVVVGLPFHLYFMDNMDPADPYHIEIVNPHIRIFGDTAYATYNLLLQRMVDGKPKITRANETRIFHKQDGWKMVHFHRS